MSDLGAMSELKRASYWLANRIEWWAFGRPGLTQRRECDRLYAGGAFDESAAALRSAYQAWPHDDALALRLAGQARFGFLTTDEALRIYETIAARAPRNLARRALREALNLTWERRGAKEATGWAQRLFDCPGRSSRDLFRIAALWNEIGRVDAALDILRDARRKAPGDLSRLGYLDLVAAADRAGVGGVATGTEARRLCELLDAGEGRFAGLVGNGEDVAIVANGPGLTGCGRGAVIDAHRIVIRFNNHTGGRGLVDQGERTDIWIRPPGVTHVPLGSVRGIRNLVLTGCNARHRFSNAISVLEPFLEERPPIEFIPFEIYRSLFHRLEASPSSGLIGLAWLAERAGGLVDESHVFGYSPGENSKAISYYYGKRVEGAWPSRHNWPAEETLVRALVSAPRSPAS